MSDEILADPFHVSRSGDGKNQWFSARDPASGLSVPAKSRDDAYALVTALNAACRLFAARNSAELLAVAQGMLPRNLCLTNSNIPDSTVVPLEVTMGELRKIAAVVAKATGK